MKSHGVFLRCAQRSRRLRIKTLSTCWTVLLRVQRSYLIPVVDERVERPTGERKGSELFTAENSEPEKGTSLISNESTHSDSQNGPNELLLTSDISLQLSRRHPK